MSKKRRRSSKRTSHRGWRASPEQVEAWLGKLERQMMAEKYKSAVQTAWRILRHVPEGSKPCGETLMHLGTALAMLQEFEESYQVLSQALEVEPEDANIWYNRALSARFTLRTGESLRDLERAVEFERDPGRREIYEEALSFTRELVREQIAKRGPDFTLEQLIEQQETFWQGIKLMEAQQWAEAEAVFRRVIEMGRVPPQPWANLAGCLIWQERYDEAEEALHRALEIEPDYEVARRNLQMLPYIRQHGPSIMGTRIKAPFEGLKVKQSVIFVEE
jgi:Flp pilus assembly protein TadD